MAHSLPVDVRGRAPNRCSNFTGRLASRLVQSSERSVDDMSPALPPSISSFEERCRTALRTGANVLVTGHHDLPAPFDDVYRGEFLPPIARTSAGARMDFRRARTLIIDDVHLLDAAGQSALAEWIRDPANAGSQIVSIASVPLYSLVQAGRFDEDLYYRLNTIVLNPGRLDD